MIDIENRNETITRQEQDDLTDQRLSSDEKDDNVHDNVDDNEYACPECDKTFEKYNSLKMHMIRSHKINPDAGEKVEASASKRRIKAKEDIRPIEERLEVQAREEEDEETIPGPLDYLDDVMKDYGISRRQAVLRRLSLSEPTDLIQVQLALDSVGVTRPKQRAVIDVFARWLDVPVPEFLEDKLAPSQSERGYEPPHRWQGGEGYVRGDHDLRRRDYGRYQDDEPEPSTGNETAQIITSVREVFEGAYRRDDNRRLGSDPELQHLRDQMKSLEERNKAMESKLEEERAKRVEQQISALHDEVKGLKDELSSGRSQNSFDVQMGRQNVASSALDKFLMINMLQNSDNLDPRFLEIFGIKPKKAKQLPENREEAEHPLSEAWQYADSEYVEVLEE